MKMNTRRLLSCVALSLFFAIAPLTTYSARAEVAKPMMAASVNRNALAGTEWTLDSPTYAGLEKAPVLKFADRQLNASVGLNTIFGAYAVDGNGIIVKPLGSTKMAGPKSEMQAETRYAKALQGVRRFALSASGERLTLHGDQTLILHRANRASSTKNDILAWTEWTLISPTYAGLEKAPVLLFSDSQVHASVGLNSLFGGYAVDGNRITVKPLASTKMAGSKSEMQAETHYAEALQSARSFDVSANGDQLTLRGDQVLTFHATKKMSSAMNNVLAWTEWTLTSPTYGGLKNAPVLKFTNSQLSASVGLNAISGAYTTDAQKISVGSFISTMMAGPKPLMEAESAYSKALQSVRSFTISENGKRLTLQGDQTLIFRLTKHTSQGFVPTASKIINVAPQLGSAMDGDTSPHYLQLEDLSQGVSWGHFTEPKIIDFDFVPGYRYQLRVEVERNAHTGEKRLRLLEVFSKHWMRTAKLGANDKILEVAPTKVDCVGVAPMSCLQVREAGRKWMNLHAPIEGFQFQEGWRYRLQVAVTHVANPPADGSGLRYRLVRVLDKMPVTY